MKQTITTSIDKADYAALEHIAKAEDRSVASLLRKATREYLKAHRFNKPTGFIKPTHEVVAADNPDLALAAEGAGKYPVKR